MVTVLCSPAIDHDIVAIVSLERKRHLEDGVAGPEHAQVATDLLSLFLRRQAALPLLDELVLHDGPTTMVKVLDHVEEAGVGGRLHVRQVLRNHMRLCEVAKL